MKHTKTSIALASAAILAVGTQFAGAVPSLRLTSGAASRTVTDENLSNALFGIGTAPDLSLGVPGQVTGSFSIGVFTITLTSGITYPVLGSLTSPHMDLLNVSVTSNTLGTLTIEFSEDGFGPPNGTGAFLAWGGTTGGSATYAAFADVGNTLFAKTTQLGSTLSGIPAAFSGSSSGGSPLLNNATFSLTQVVTVNHTAAGQATSFDASLGVPDGGTTLALLGCSMLGLGAIRRKFGKR